MNITENAVVLFHYILTDGDGVQLDSSTDTAPLAYIHGHKNIIPGLEQAMEGKKEGDTMKVTVPAADAYGEYQDHLVQEVPRQAFQGIDDVKPGMRFEAQTPSGPVSVVVTAATDDTVTVDGNHPLAGKELTFDVKIETVREASEEELAHGHVHGAGGHEH